MLEIKRNSYLWTDPFRGINKIIFKVLISKNCYIPKANHKDH